jgi:hypothetical protein
MNFTWSDFTGMKIPLWETITGMAAAIGITWAAFAWADDIEDKQKVTQTQLDQLVVIVTKTTTDNAEKDRMQDADIDKIEDNFDLLRQEIEIRRELEEASDDDT